MQLMIRLTTRQINIIKETIVQKQIIEPQDNKIILKRSDIEYSVEIQRKAERKISSDNTWYGELH